MHDRRMMHHGTVDDPMDRVMHRGAVNHRVVHDGSVLLMGLRDLLVMGFGRHRRRLGQGRSTEQRRNGSGDGGKMTYAHNIPHWVNNHTPRCGPVNEERQRIN
jgi:hypothetical protein